MTDFELHRESRFRRLSRWGLESGGLRATTILGFALLCHGFASWLRFQTGFAVDMTALGVMFCALELGLERGVLMSLAVGYIGDAYAGFPTGLWLFGAGATYVALRLVIVRVVGASVRTLLALSSFAVLVGFAARSVLASSGGYVLHQQVDLPIVVFGTALFSVPTYWGYRWLSDRFRKREDTLFR